MLPIVRNKCLDCHGKDQSLPYFASASNPADEQPAARQVYETLLAPAESRVPQGASGKYVDPGKARTSPLTWHLLGQNTSRPWDSSARDGAWKPIPASAKTPLTENDRRAFIEWIDTGAAWDNRPALRDAEEQGAAGEGGVKERGGM